jgi:putative nucleotidyltransferase with HDIG domain
MTSFFLRKRLIRRGLASQKSRRRLTRREWVETLRHGGVARTLLVVGMALPLVFLVGAGAAGWNVERLVVAGLIYALSLAVVWLNHPGVWRDNSRLLLLFGTLVVHLEVVQWVVARAMEFAVESAVEPASVEGALRAASAVDRRMLWDLSIPYALGPLAISLLLGQRLSIVLTIFASLLGAMIPGGLDARFLTESMLCGFVAALTTRKVRRRADLLKAGAAVGLTTWGLSLVMGRIGPLSWEKLSALRWMGWETIAWESAAAVFSGVGAAFLVSAILPVIEGIFRVTTSITWLELADLNHPLLKRMTLEAPGTYHHSLIVAQLAEAAAESVGANAEMVRVASYFHDIGKLVKPEYFVENARHGRDAHEGLAPTMSALVIIAHVKEGVDLALQHRLNREIIDVIQQHHGTSLVYYFYRKALAQQEEARKRLDKVHEEDLPEVREESFRYPGPRPQSRESAIISLADTVESASRCLEKVTPAKIDQLVDELFQRRLIEGQLRECELTMCELEEVAESFKRTLRSMMHSRIAYPKAQEKSGLGESSGARLSAAGGAGGARE